VCCGIGIHEHRRRTGRQLNLKLSAQLVVHQGKSPDEIDRFAVYQDPLGLLSKSHPAAHVAATLAWANIGQSDLLISSQLLFAVSKRLMVRRMSSDGSPQSARLLLRPRHRSVKQGRIEQTALNDRDHKQMAANRVSAALRSTACATMSIGSSWPIGPFSPGPSTQVIPKLAAAIREKIARLKALVDVHDLKSLEPEKLRAASEELIVGLQKAAAKIGLDRPRSTKPPSNGEGPRSPPAYPVCSAAAREIPCRRFIVAPRAQASRRCEHKRR
jgi:hypothetical protein